MNFKCVVVNDLKKKNLAALFELINTLVQRWGRNTSGQQSKKTFIPFKVTIFSSFFIMSVEVGSPMKSGPTRSFLNGPIIHGSTHVSSATLSGRGK